MSFLTALDTTKYNALHGNGSPRSYKASQFMCVNSNTVLFKTIVSVTPTTDSYASLTFGSTISGSSASVQAGMSVYAGVEDDIRKASFKGRARDAVSGSVLPINETSSLIISGMYLWVVLDFKPFHELGRVSGGTYYKDYSQTFLQLRPIISNLQSAYAGVVSGSPAGYTVAFAAQAIAATAGATISSYAWTFPAGTTVTAGATNTANVTVRFNASAAEYWIKLIVTDSGGRTQTRWIPVWAVPADYSTTVVRGFTGARVEGSIDSGWTATVDAFAGVDSLLDGTLCCIFNVEYYQDTAYSLFSNVEFVGRFNKENNAASSDEIYSTKRKVGFEIEGTAAQLARISAPEITAQDAASPSVWDQISTLTVWRGITYLLEHSTAHQLFSLSFDDTGNSYRAFQLEISGQNQYEAVKDLASSIDATFEFAPTGEMRVVIGANYLSEVARDSLATIADFTASDWINISDLQREYNDTVGLVEASGGTYAPTGGGVSQTAVQVILSIAPGVAQGNGDGTTTLSKQILLADVDRATAQDELNTRTANHFVIVNGTDTLNVDMRGAYHWLIPSANQWYTWTIAAQDNRRGLVFTSEDRWLLKSISIEQDNIRGNKTVSASFALETSAADAGVTGQTVLIPPQNVTPPILPSLPPFFSYPYSPPLPDVYLPPNPTINDIPPVQLPQLTNGIPLDGNTVAIFSDDHVWVTKNFISTPIWIDVTPDNLLGTVRDIRKIGYGLYVLASDGDTSILYYRENVFSVGVWSPGEELIGTYTQIIPSSTEGAVYVEGLGEGDGLWTIYTYGNIIAQDEATVTVEAVWVPSESKYLAQVVSPGVNSCRKRTSLDSFTGATPSAYATNWILCGNAQIDANFVGGIYLNACVNAISSSANDPFTVVFAIVPEDLCGSTGVVLQTAYSTDYGATFATPELVDTTGGGADTVKIGSVVLASGSAQVKKATTGGAYADYGSALPAGFAPIALWIPRFQFGSTTSSNNSSTPQYLIASSAVDSDDATLYKVTASGATFTDITPIISGDTYLGLGNYAVTQPWFSGSRLAAIGMFGSLPRLVTSTNSGTSWSDRGVLPEASCAVWFRNSDKTLRQLFLAAGQPAYSPDFGVHIYSKSYPADYTSEPIRGLQVYG